MKKRGWVEWRNVCWSWITYGIALGIFPTCLLVVLLLFHNQGTAFHDRYCLFFFVCRNGSRLFKTDSNTGQKIRNGISGKHGVSPTLTCTRGAAPFFHMQTEWAKSWKDSPTPPPPRTVLMKFVWTRASLFASSLPPPSLLPSFPSLLPSSLLYLPSLLPPCLPSYLPACLSLSLLPVFLQPPLPPSFNSSLTGACPWIGKSADQGAWQARETEASSLPVGWDGRRRTGRKLSDNLRNLTGPHDHRRERDIYCRML